MKGQKRYISVILPLKLGWEPCYSLPEEKNIPEGSGIYSDVTIGDRVKVMFSGKEYTGVVSETDIEPGTDLSRIKDIISMERRLGKITPEELSLWRRVAEYYLCTIGEVYKAAYPSVKIYSEEISARRQERLEVRMAAIARKQERAKERLHRLHEKQENVIARIEKKRQELATAKENRKEKHISGLASLNALLDEIRNKIDTLENDLEISRRVSAETATCSHMAITLSEPQRKALDEIKDAFTLHRTALLRGVTGSGKTEIYITLAWEALSKGKNVLYLVPEIALSKQLEERLFTVFGDSLMVFHSGESIASRTLVSETIRKDRSYIVLGTRSAIFLPHRELGLIIVDEEHDSSYKQDSPAPRYNGRDTAVMLGAIHSGNVLLGSATPSLESLYNCKSGKYTLVELNSRYHGNAETEVELIDTVQERKKRGMRGSLSLKLIIKIDEVLKKGGQAIILRSRRSYSPVLQCSECGFIPKCPHCNVSLSYHKSVEKEICHYCGTSRKHTGICPECGGELVGLGAGTQKIEEEISMLFPQARTARLDSDSSQDRKFESETIRKFGRGEIDILIGTQTVTKGFDFGGLSLVAVIGSDSLLAQQDFRADEKALQILVQFMGRCARRGNKGTFIIQTAQPQHPVYRYIAGIDKSLSDSTLLDERREFGYPPFCRIIDISVRDSMEDRAEKMALRLGKALSDTGLRITGPYSPSTGMNAGRHIRNIRIYINKDKNLKANKKSISDTIDWLEKQERYSGHISVNVDPA